MSSDWSWSSTEDDKEKPTFVPVAETSESADVFFDAVEEQEEPVKRHHRTHRRRASLAVAAEPPAEVPRHKRTFSNDLTAGAQGRKHRMLSSTSSASCEAGSRSPPGSRSPRRHRRRRDSSARSPPRSVRPNTLSPQPEQPPTSSPLVTPDESPRDYEGEFPPPKKLEPFVRTPWLLDTRRMVQDDPDRMPAAFLARLSEEKRAAMARVRSQLRCDPWFMEAFVDELEPYRRLQAMGWDEAKALRQLQATYEWATREHPEHMVCEKCLADPDSHNIVILGYDRVKRPVFYMNFERIRDRDPDGIIRHTVVTMQTLIKCMPQGVQQWVSLVDFKGFGISWVQPSLGKKYFTLFNDYYAERLGKLMLIEPPGIFTAVWTVVKGMMEPTTVAKIEFLPLKNVEREFHGLFDDDLCTTLMDHMGRDRFIEKGWFK